MKTNYKLTSAGLVAQDGTTYGPDDLLPDGEAANVFVNRMATNRERLTRTSRDCAPSFMESLEVEPHDASDILAPISLNPLVVNFIADL